MRRLYSALMYVASPVAYAIVLWRGLRNRRYWEALSERFGFGKTYASPTIWVHAVSLGEVTAAAPLIRALRTRHPQCSLILTTATPTGRARAQALFGDSIAVRFLPYDLPGSMRRFVDRVNPRVAVIMETELWPNLFDQCRRRGVPVVLASARLSPKSVARYRTFGALFRPVFAGGPLVAAQSAEDAERFIAIGADRSKTHVIGNVKFDVDIDPAVVQRGVELRAAILSSRPVWIAGSTHAGEEELVLNAHAELKTQIPGALLLLVPRHPRRFHSVAELLNRRGVRFERRSSSRLMPAAALPPELPVLLVDTVGELTMLYAAADVAFVGGSLIPVGGHNLLEPAALGLPVITGPYQANSADIARVLLEQGAAVQVADARQLTDALLGLFADPARRAWMGECGRRAVEANRGSVARLLALIEPCL